MTCTVLRLTKAAGGVRERRTARIDERVGRLGTTVVDAQVIVDILPVGQRGEEIARHQWSVGPAAEGRAALGGRAGRQVAVVDRVEHEKGRRVAFVLHQHHEARDGGAPRVACKICRLQPLALESDVEPEGCAVLVLGLHEGDDVVRAASGLRMNRKVR
jgi:hypothetical protein